MKKIFMVIALLATNISWAQGDLILREYKHIPWKIILKRVIKAHPHVDSKYIEQYFNNSKKLIQKDKAYLCIAERKKKFVAQAVLNPQTNDLYRQELVALTPDAIIDESSIHEFTDLLKQKYPKMKGLVCCFPECHLEGFKTLLEETGYKLDPSAAEDTKIMKKSHGIDSSNYLWYSHKFTEKE